MFPRRFNSSSSAVAFPSAPVHSSSPPSTPRAFPGLPGHSRRQTYGGDLNGITRQLVLGYEQSIALLEAKDSQIPVDPVDRQTDDAAIKRQTILLPTTTTTTTALDLHINQQSDLLYERKLRMEVLETLKKIRAQNALLSRSIREFQDKNAALTEALEAETDRRMQIEAELKRLYQANFTLLEHNKLLVGRDSALQEDISTLITKSQADDWMRNVLEDELRSARQNSPEPTDPDLFDQRRNSLVSLQRSPQHESLKRRSMAITLEHSGPLRAQLTAARDELHITQRLLAESEKKCAELTEKIAAIHLNMTQCVDSSAQALEVERELRAEVTERLACLEEENVSLRSTIDTLRQELEDLKNPSRSSSSSTPQPVPINIAPDMSLIQACRKITFDKDPGVQGSPVKTPQNLCLSKSKSNLTLKATGCPPILARPLSFISPSRSSSLEFPDTPDTLSTLVGSTVSSRHHTPSNSKDTSRRTFRPRPLSLAPDPACFPFLPNSPLSSSRPSAGTLPKNPRSLALLQLTGQLPSSFQFPTSTLKSSTVTNSETDVMDPVIVKGALRRSNMQRASAVLSSIARTYGEVDGPSEWVHV